MAKRKLKTGTLTKIDPSILKPKPVATSQHAGHKGARVIATVNPVRQPLPPADSLGFNFDLENFDSDTGHPGLDPANIDEECVDDGDSRGYYVARVRVFSLVISGYGLTIPRIIRSRYGGVNATYFYKNLFDLKVGGCPIMTLANSATRKASSGVSIVLQSNSFARAA
jgi:hypothetical protein